MKKLVLISLSFIFISCVSVKFPEKLSINLELDKESAKNLTQAINNSNYKTTMMRHHFEDDEATNKILVGHRLSSKYMNDLPEVIIQRIEKASEKGIDIKIDTIISENGEKKEIKIEFKIDDN